MTSSDEVLKAFVDKTGARATPVIEVGDQLVKGFDRGKLQRLLNLE